MYDKQGSSLNVLFMLGIQLGNLSKTGKSLGPVLSLGAMATKFLVANYLRRIYNRSTRYPRGIMIPDWPDGGFQKTNFE